MDDRLQCKSKQASTMKLMEENTGKYIYNIEFVSIFKQDTEACTLIYTHKTLRKSLIKLATKITHLSSYIDK